MEKADARFIALCLFSAYQLVVLCRCFRGNAEDQPARLCAGGPRLRCQPRASWPRHILPNVGHIILITFVLDFSSLVLAEAVLSYIGVGIDPSMGSWGNMINGARSELSREPVVWWTLTGAFFFMFALVLAANLFSDLVRDAFDPRTATGRSAT